jgi:imidazolonepropionase-like amidohydrolase
VTQVEPDLTGSLALVGGTVIDVRRGLTLEEHTVVIASGKIPGLIDMHVHVSGDGRADLLPLFPAHGVTTVRDTGGILTSLHVLRQDLEAARRIGPRLFYAGPILDGLPAIWPFMTLLVDTERRAEAAVRFLAAHDVDVIKVYNSVPEASLGVIVRSAHELDLPVTGHVPRAITMTRAIELGVDGLEHIRITGREMLTAEEADRLDYLPVREREPLLWERYDPVSPKFERLARRLAEARVFVDPTFVVDHAMVFPEDHGASRDDLPGWIDDALAKIVRPAQMAPVPPELREAGRSMFEKRLRFVGLCAAAGVRLIAGTDLTGPGEQLPGRGLQRELAFLVMAGLTPLEALRAATVTAAEALRREEELGAIEVGKVADIVVLDRDPLADIQNVGSVRLVVQRGRAATVADLLRAPEQRAAAAARS